MTDAQKAALIQLIHAADAAYYQGDFRNGVTDATGTIDEGEVRMGELLSRAIFDIRAAFPEETAHEDQDLGR